MLGLRGERGTASVDALGLLASAAGYDDAERWWEDVIEHRRDGVPPFVAIGEAMAAIRAEVADRPPQRTDDAATDEGASPSFGGIREAHMRSVLRAARR